VTRDDITYVFDITTGEIIHDTVGDTPFVPHDVDGNAFGFFVNEGALPLWAQESTERAGELGLMSIPFTLDSEEVPQEQHLPSSPLHYASISVNQSLEETYSPTSPISMWRRPLVWVLLLALAITVLTLILRLRASKRR
jgi:hypothetical protein